MPLSLSMFTLLIGPVINEGAIVCSAPKPPVALSRIDFTAVVVAQMVDDLPIEQGHVTTATTDIRQVLKGSFRTGVQRLNYPGYCGAGRAMKAGEKQIVYIQTLRGYPSAEYWMSVDDLMRADPATARLFLSWQDKLPRRERVGR